MFVLLIVAAGGLLRFCAMRVNIYVCMSYRTSDEEFYRGFLNFEPFLFWGFGLLEEGLAYLAELLLRL